MKDLEIFGEDLFGKSIKPPTRGPVTERFVEPPFSVLSASKKEWVRRKKDWMLMGIQSELGRKDKLVYDFPPAEGKEKYFPDFKSGTSVFDPVLCELCIRWWSGEGAQVVDPFAGGSVRGVVASHLGRKYWGCDLSAAQIAANNEQAVEMGLDPKPVWVVGDSMQTLSSAPFADYIFSCPPYGDLEVYSDDPADLSTMPWSGFIDAYRDIIRQAVGRLKEDRFACFVVGDFRDKDGFYVNFVSTTIQAFEDAGAHLYNEAILATSPGSAGIRVSRQFKAGRKLCKIHQNVLVFCKGDPKRATEACGPVDMCE